MKRRLDTEVIAMRAAAELRDGDIVNLGTGIPNIVPNYIPEGKVYFHAENGIIGFGRVLSVDEQDLMDYNLVNAGGQFVSAQPGMCIVDHATSFVVVRGGRLDVTILGAYQVSEKGDLANWSRGVQGKSGGIGGSMDMPVGARKVIITMEHTTSRGEHRILDKCTYPLTARECVDLIITDVAVIEVTRHGLLLKETAPGWMPEEIQALTGPRLSVSPDLREFQIA